jgi:hypothetical protein
LDTRNKQDEPIKFAETPSGSHTEETFEDREEAELDEAWDLNAAEDAPTECCQNTRRKMRVLSKQILLDRKLL